MRVGVVTTGYPRGAGCGAGVFVGALARAIAEEGHDVEVLAPEPARAWDPAAHLDATVTARATPQVMHVPYLRPRALQRTFYGAGAPENLASGDPAAWLGALTYPLALAAAVRTRATRWDAVVSHWALPSALAVGLARTTGARRPHVAFLHSADVHLLARMPFAERWASAILAAADAVRVASSAGRETFVATLPTSQREAARAKVRVAPMGVEEAWVEPREREAARDALGVTGFVVLALARLTPIKGLDVAIDACAPLTGTMLVVAGEGPERARLERRAREQGSAARFLGWTTGPEKRRWLAAADAVVVPSRVLASGRTEGTPVAALEALAAGVPVVASDVGGLRDALGGGGLLVPPDDPGALGDALATLARDPQRWASLRAEAGARPPHTARALARETLAALADAQRRARAR